MSLYDINPSELIKLVATELKKDDHFKIPTWAMFVKTGAGKERLPVDPDWWYFRTASVLRKCVVLGPIGVSKLRVKYGNRKNRGVKPAAFSKGSGKIIRVVLQQLEKKGFVKQTEKGVHKGRIVTPQGLKFINQVIKNGRKQTTKSGTPEKS